MAGKPITRKSDHVTGTEVDPLEENADAPETETDGAGHVTETGGNEVGIVIVVGGVGHVTGIDGTEGRAIVRDLVQGSGRQSLWQRRRERGQRRKREREGTTGVEGERSQFGGILHHEVLSTFHHCNTKLCKVCI